MSVLSALDDACRNRVFPSRRTPEMMPVAKQFTIQKLEDRVAPCCCHIIFTPPPICPPHFCPPPCFPPCEFGHGWGFGHGCGGFEHGCGFGHGWGGLPPHFR